MIYSGLVSVTFRKLSPDRIVKLASEAGLSGIEWGGDIHVPHGNLRRAVEVAAMTAAAGLRMASYGSYFIAGEPEDKLSFQCVLDTAHSLGAPTIRVWAGNKGSADANGEHRKRVAGHLRDICMQARRAGITVACEYHGGTLTDTCASAVDAMESAESANLKCYWQPNAGLSPEERLKEIEGLSAWLSNIHVFHWDNDGKLPLADGLPEWRRYMHAIAAAPGDRYAMLEFVRNDSPEQFMNDAKTLKSILNDAMAIS